METLVNFFLFWKTVGLDRIVRFFWYFFFLELTRYVLFDFAVITWYLLQKRRNREKYLQARQKLYAESPKVSVIAPGKNEGENLYKLARSLNEQTYRNLEIIIIDDGSDDQTPLIAQSLLKAGLIDRFLRNEVRGGKASAANLGLRFATGKFIVHVDADSSLDRDAIERILIPFYLDPCVGAVGGNVKVRNWRTNVITALQAIEYLKTISVARLVSSMLGIYRVVPGAYGAFRRDLLDQVGGWDIGPGLDGDITIKIRKAHCKIVFEPTSVCYTRVPESLRALTRQRLRWYRSLVRFRIRKHRDIFLPHANFRWSNWISFAENLFYNVVLDITWLVYIVDILAHFPTLIGYILPMNYFLYLFSNVFQFFAVLILSERRHEEWKLSLYLPLIVPYIGLYLRFVRTIAYLQEIFFRSSYKDLWNPRKTSAQAKAHGL